MRRTAVVALGLALLAGCGDDGGDEQTVDAGATTTSTAVPGSTAAPGGDTPLGTPSSEPIGFEVFQELPQPTGDTATADRPPLTGWGGSAVLIGPAGGLVRLDTEQGAEVTPTEGLDVAEGENRVRAVDLLASSDDSLLAFGHEEDLLADVEPPIRPFAWRSEDDGDTWEALELSGLDGGSDEVTITALVGMGEGRFMAGGEIDDGNQTTLVVWLSDDGGESWEEMEGTGLDHTDNEEESEHLVGLAVGPERILAIREETGLDDSRITILQLGDSEQWEELEPTGLDALDLPNSDIIPTVASVSTFDGPLFTMFASVPADDDEPFGERIPTLFTSDDGEHWDATELEGPTLPDPFFVQAITGTEFGAVAVAEGEDALNVWRFTDD